MLEPALVAALEARTEGWAGRPRPAPGLLAVDRGDPAALNDALLEVVQRPDELDEPALERALGQFMARHVGPGITPDVRMFTDLFRIVAAHGLSVPPEIAGAFRALATIEGTLTDWTGSAAPSSAGALVSTSACSPTKATAATSRGSCTRSLTFLAATLGVMPVLLLGLHGGPSVTHTVTLYTFFGYRLLVFAGVLALRVLVLIFRPHAG